METIDIKQFGYRCKGKDSVQLATIETHKDNLIAQFNDGLITEQQLAYCMHILGNLEDPDSYLDNQNSEEHYVRERMMQAIKNGESAFNLSMAKSRSQGLDHIHRKYVSARWGTLKPKPFKEKLNLWITDLVRTI